MKRNHRIYCRDSSQCPPGKTCINGECTEDIIVGPPDEETPDDPVEEDEG